MLHRCVVQDIRFVGKWRLQEPHVCSSDKGRFGHLKIGHVLKSVACDRTHLHCTSPPTGDQTRTEASGVACTEIDDLLFQHLGRWAEMVTAFDFSPEKGILGYSQHVKIPVYLLSRCREGMRRASHKFLAQNGHEVACTSAGRPVKACSTSSS